MQIYVNGILREVKNECTAHDLIDLLCLTNKRIALEVNNNLIPRSQFSQHYFGDQDRIEIIHAVGGG